MKQELFITAFGMAMLGAGVLGGTRVASAGDAGPVAQISPLPAPSMSPMSSPAPNPT